MAVAACSSEAKRGALPKYSPMRCRASHWIAGPTSLSTSFLIAGRLVTALPSLAALAAPADPASTIPIKPPMLVPIQSSLAGWRCASSASMSPT